MNFQAVYLPELQLQVSPELTFYGNLEKFSARGVILVPEMQINPRDAVEVITPSRDVVIAGRAAVSHKRTGPALDLQAKVILGDRVFVKSAGLDASLAGDIDVTVRDYDTITGRGEIRVAKGTYNFYGVTLGIVRGRALFGGGDVRRPILDILALRTIDDVKVGVTVTGTLEFPLIKLYSEPLLPEVDILSYLVMGQRLGEKGDQIALLTTAASLLASSRESTPFAEQVRKRLGLDTMGLTSGREPLTGYRAVESSLNPGSSATTDSNGISQSMFQVGKYLTPKLYISYGRSLFNQQQQVRARYSITKRWEVESKISSDATGGDMYYRIEFD
jgi:translocation and assembly module TamB